MIKTNIWASAAKSIVFVLVDNWNIRRGLSPLIAENRSPQDSLIALIKMTEKEIKLLLKKVMDAEQSGNIVDVKCSDSFEERLKVCLADNDRNIVHILIKIKYGTNVNSALNREIESIESKEVRDFYRTTTLIVPLPSFFRGF